MQQCQSTYPTIWGGENPNPWKVWAVVKCKDWKTGLNSSHPKALSSNVCSFKFNYFLFENGTNETEYLSWFRRAVWIVCKQDWGQTNENWLSQGVARWYSMSTCTFAKVILLSLFSMIQDCRSFKHYLPGDGSFLLAKSIKCRVHLGKKEKNLENYNIQTLKKVFIIILIKKYMKHVNICFTHMLYREKCSNLLFLPFPPFQKTCDLWSIWSEIVQ